MIHNVCVTELTFSNDYCVKENCLFYNCAISDLRYLTAFKRDRLGHQKLTSATFMRILFTLNQTDFF